MIKKLNKSYKHNAIRKLTVYKISSFISRAAGPDYTKHWFTVWWSDRGVRSDWLNFIGESCLCLANQEMQGPVLPDNKRSILAESTKDNQYYLESSSKMESKDIDW